MPRSTAFEQFTHAVSLRRWSQMDPMSVVDSVRECIDGVMKSNPSLKAEVRSRVMHSLIDPVILSCDFASQDFKGIGITNQRETTVLWDQAPTLHHPSPPTTAPLHPSPVSSISCLLQSTEPNPVASPLVL